MFDVDEFIISCEDMKILHSDYSIAEEGTNWDIKKLMREKCKQVRKCISNASKAKKAGDYDKAIEELDNAAEILTQLKKDIKNPEHTVMDAVAGFFLDYIVEIGKTILVGITTLGIGLPILMIKNLKTIISGLINLIRDVSKDNLTTDNFNMVVQRALDSIDSYRLVINEMKKAIRKKKKENGIPDDDNTNVSADSNVE